MTDWFMMSIYICSILAASRRPLHFSYQLFQFVHLQIYYHSYSRMSSSSGDSSIDWYAPDGVGEEDPAAEMESTRVTKDKAITSSPVIKSWTPMKVPPPSPTTK